MSNQPQQYLVGTGDGLFPTEPLSREQAAILAAASGGHMTEIDDEQAEWMSSFRRAIPSLFPEPSRKDRDI